MPVGKGDAACETGETLGYREIKLMIMDLLFPFKNRVGAETAKNCTRKILKHCWQNSQIISLKHYFSVCKLFKFFQFFSSSMFVNPWVDVTIVKIWYQIDLWKSQLYNFQQFFLQRDQLRIEIDMNLSNRLLLLPVLLPTSSSTSLFHSHCNLLLLLLVSASSSDSTPHSHQSGILGEASDNDLQWVSSFPSK